MKNKLVSVQSVNQTILSDGLTIVLDGNNIRDKGEFLCQMERAFAFPYPCGDNGDAFLDFMRDLDWIESDKINLVITHKSAFLKEDFHNIPMILHWFNDIILPFWEKDVLTCVVAGKTKEFTVFLVETVDMNA